MLNNSQILIVTKAISNAKQNKGPYATIRDPFLKLMKSWAPWNQHGTRQMHSKENKMCQKWTSSQKKRGCPSCILEKKIFVTIEAT